MTHQKVKSVAKEVTVKGNKLEKTVLNTMKLISEIVGVTLGPGGQPVIVERFESGIPSSVTKDGVSVFKALGFNDATAHCIMETARDAAMRTASEAGDGTTTATILAEAVVRKISEYCKTHPRVSPQKVVRHLESVFKNTIEPEIKSISQKIEFHTPEGRKTLKAVAKISANGDEELAEKVLECFDVVGDQGNVTISELSGPSSYEVEKIEGYPIYMGYEESCGKFYQKFINDSGMQRTFMENCYFVVYHGIITEIQSLLPLINKIGSQWNNYLEKVEGYDLDRHNVVVVATGFSENVLGQLAINFANPNTINVFPLIAPKSQQINGQLFFLEDVAAFTGATILDPLNKPLDTAEIEHLGPGVTTFEAYRYRSTILGFADENILMDLAANVTAHLDNPESELDLLLTQERLGKLTGGIARLKVIGPSSGELKEKRDRAEDAVCAVKGAIKAGCLPGGGWTLLKLIYDMSSSNDEVIEEVLAPALIEPVVRLLTNCGLRDNEVGEVVNEVVDGIKNGKYTVYNAAEHQHVDAFESGILDSTPAVLEAIRNSLSIAALLGTLGGAIVFARDLQLERQEASDTQEFLRNAHINEANERF